MKEYWLFTLECNDTKTNAFFEFFPTALDLKLASKGEEYTIINFIELTERQYNKLTEHGTIHK
jgi:hypothetical protein